MTGFISLIITFAEGGLLDLWYRNIDPYMNYPGFEAWRFINLIIFFGIAVYLLKKPLSEAFKARRDAIREELIRAEEERKAAVAELAEIEVRLAGFETEKAALIESAGTEAEAEKKRIEEEVRANSERLRVQAESEIERKSLQARARLLRFTAEESIRLAEEKIRRSMSPETDARLVRANIRSIGGMK